MDSYTDPTDGKPYNFGVQAWVDYGNSTQFFDRFNIPLAQLNLLTLDAIYADFSTGQTLNNYTGPSIDELVVALQTYLTVCEKYESCQHLEIFLQAIVHSCTNSLFSHCAWLMGLPQCKQHSRGSTVEI